jgi:hypothetical protein
MIETALEQRGIAWGIRADARELSALPPASAVSA